MGSCWPPLPPRPHLPAPRYPHRLSVEWSAHRIRDILLHGEIETEQEFGNGEVVQIRVVIPSALAGKTVQDVTVVGEIAVSVIVRAGESRARRRSA